MRIAVFALACIAVAPALATNDSADTVQWVATEKQVVNMLTNKHVEYETIYDSRNFGLPAPDSLRLRTSDGLNIFAYEICPDKPKAVVICLSGIENPSVTAFYGHAAEFYKADIATIMPDVRGHGLSDGQRICLAYQEDRDVKAVTDYVGSDARYKGLPVIVMGVSMGASIAIRSIGGNEDIDALISLSAFSSIEDFLSYARAMFMPTIPAERIEPVTAAVVRNLYGVDSKTSSPIAALKGLNGRPALMMHSKGDLQVPYTCFEKLTAEAARHTSKLQTFTVEGDEHFICKEFTTPTADAEYMARIMAFINEIVTKSE